ncbi:GNAT family N-acetyltransferase [Alkalicoccobacillus murimartini]|uniref:GNAT superfamily N-acetyltransferase n=1 Tax=Alkalicoccobacillus murimartini TaxID=171685 RepID=A0ABT9YHL9_9BACI|nr:GNAT family N-acetyltransferase [Alkalicoccobacillus murimartini]MDQ0207332.1 GNAT superfamily N-acetyltransferase [Alkalicoccobacillus murimartini]
MNIYQATIEDTQHLSILFNAYREFYYQETDLAGASSYISERLKQKDSVLFVAEHEGKYVGFAQLYPTFSSIAMQKAFILNDLFVAEEARKNGIGDQLLLKVKDYALAQNVLRLSLSTAIHNKAAQRLYEKHGYVRDTDFYHYQLTLED